MRAPPLRVLRLGRAPTRRGPWAGALIGVGLCACSQGGTSGGVAPAGSSSEVAAASASSSPAGVLDLAEDRIREVRAAELTRVPTGVRPADLTSRVVSLRRAAVRALARMRTPGAREALLGALRDEDDEVVAWAAYGIGDACGGNPSELVRALGATLVRLEPRAGAASPGALDARAAIVRAVGRCADALSEPLLVEWARARGDVAESAVFALGDVATKTNRLREETLVALLELGAGTASSEPWGVALYPLGRVAHLPPSVIEHAREVAIARLEEGGASAPYAARALGRTDERATTALAKVVKEATATAALRVEAIRSLARLGPDGQKALRTSLGALVPDTSDPVKATLLVSSEFGVVLTALESLTAIGEARSTLDRFARLAAPNDAPGSVVRRVSWLRCAAARLLAERDFEHPQLVACDLESEPPKAGATTRLGSIGARALVSAIGTDGTQIRGKRYKAWARWAFGDDVRAREAALGLIADHPETEDVSRALSEALAAPYPGILAAAAEVIAKHPSRLSTNEKDRDAALAREALVRALDGKGAAADLEALTAAIDAAGALKLAAARASLHKLCRAPHEVVRQHAERALRSFADRAECRASEAPLPRPAELAHVVSGKLKVVFATDAGELTLELESTLAPVTVTRFAELARAGFFNGIVVHRVVPGFVSQLGSPTSDGYGGADGKLALPCETSPVAFQAANIGVALAGRDTGVSQLFVTHARTPHLDGQYAWLGTAKGPWDTLVDGDRITKTEVTP